MDYYHPDDVAAGYLTRPRNVCHNSIGRGVELRGVRFPARLLSPTLART